MIHNKAAFAKGAFLMVTFLAVFVAILSPLFPGKMTGLDYADDFFNKLSKNSSDYFEQVKATVAKQKGVQLDVTATIAKPDPAVQPDPAKAQEAANKDAQAAAKALQAAGATVAIKDNVITVKGDLNAILDFATTKGRAAFDTTSADQEKPEKVADRKLVKDLWKALGALVKPLQKAGKIADAKAIDQVMKKALEPGYNFYGVDGEPVSKNIFMLLFLLSFYVVYTLWYGYSIFFMFEGIGMSMKKSKKKG
uniref:Uncharacterized protein n=1 Tax=Fundidesulfovibrio putealis TaxID=270496 RepID=A0A7C3WFH7_9BACT